MPHQTLRGQSNVAKLRRNQLTVDQNQPNPFGWSSWAKPINSGLFLLWTLAFYDPYFIWDLALYKNFFWTLAFLRLITSWAGPTGQ
jgi:hypothetical protein